MPHPTPEATTKRWSILHRPTTDYDPSDGDNNVGRREMGLSRLAAIAEEFAALFALALGAPQGRERDPRVRPSPRSMRSRNV
jgi:hypothetical protein